jgi:iron(III) transport system substrate-binding protein
VKGTSILTIIFLIAFLLLPWRAPASAQVGNPDLIAQAKKEGRVTWYTTVSIPESKQFMDMLEKQYPFVKVDLLRSGSPLSQSSSASTREKLPPDVLRHVHGWVTVLKEY